MDRAEPTAQLPPLDADLTWILGRPNFTIIRAARELHHLGLYDCYGKAETEQAAVIHWMVNLYLKHGPGWRTEMERILNNPEGTR